MRSKGFDPRLNIAENCGDRPEYTTSTFAGKSLQTAYEYADIILP
jgi:hypothetical protein